jgi:hypothetical protein
MAPDPGIGSGSKSGEPFILPVEAVELFVRVSSLMDCSFEFDLTRVSELNELTVLSLVTADEIEELSFPTPLGVNGEVFTSIGLRRGDNLLL